MLSSLFWNFHKYLFLLVAPPLSNSNDVKQDILESGDEMIKESNELEETPHDIQEYDIRDESGKNDNNKYEEVNYTNKIKENFHENSEANYDDKQFMVENEKTEQMRENNIKTEMSNKKTTKKRIVDHIISQEELDYYDAPQFEDNKVKDEEISQPVSQKHKTFIETIIQH